MTVLDDLFTSVTEGTMTIEALLEKANGMDLKLDDIAIRIQNLMNGGGATPEQLESLLAVVNTLKMKIAAADVKVGENLAEADTLDGQP